MSKMSHACEDHSQAIFVRRFDRLLVGKPMDETFYDDYKEALLDIIDSNIPIVYNLNVGHATPRAIVPFGVHAHVDATEQVIRFDYNKES